MRALIFAALLAGCTTAQAASNPSAITAAPVIAAERAFAARAGEVGWIPAFREFTAPDGQEIGEHGIESAPESLAATPDDGNKLIYWAPEYAGISRSGDLGFTTGAASFDAARTPVIQYFTVWRKQPDGSWRWIYDGGPGRVTSPGPFPAAEAEIPTLPVASAGVGSAESAIAQVRAIESEHGTASSLSSYLAGDARVFRPGQARTSGGAEAAAALVYPNGDVAYHNDRTQASSAGDLVFTLGDAAWMRDTTARHGFYARIWQHRADGWRIVYDQLVGGR